MHVRTATSAQSDYVFKLGERTIDYTARYRYLGITISDNLDYTVSAEELATAASTALGALT